MPFLTHQGARLWWREDGVPDKPVLLLLNAIGTTSALWDPVLPLLLPYFRVLRMDMRGHGASDSPSVDYSMSLLAQDAAAVLDAAGVAQAAIAGISLGGMVAMQMAVSAPDRVAALLPICTSAAIDPAVWRTRLQALAEGGMAAIAETAMAHFFTPEFRAARPEIVAGTHAVLRAQDVAGYAGSCAAIRDMSLLAALPGIAAPTLVVSGQFDISAPFAGHGAHIVAAIPAAQVRMIASAHLPSLDNPAALGGIIVDFLRAGADTCGARAVLYEAGLARRREILGDAWVDRVLRNRSNFTAEYQEMITRIAWQEVWCRPGLDARTRRLLVAAITASLARWEEFRLHVRSALTQGGYSLDDLKEVLMQTAIYAGVPAANTAFAEAAAIAVELGLPAAQPLSASGAHAT